MRARLGSEIGTNDLPMTSDQSIVDSPAPHVTIGYDAGQSAAQGADNAMANQRNERDFKKARRHSLLVGTMRKALPVLALLWGGVFIANATFSLAKLPNVAVESAGIEGGKLVMKAPVMSGFDKQDRPFDVKAQRAIQDLTDSSIVDLEKIDALLPINDKTKARVFADFGTYNTEAETMKLRDNIEIEGARGMDISLNSADVNMKTGSMTSDDGVKVVSKQMTITADSVVVEDNGDRIIFKNRVKTIVKQRPKPKTKIRQ